MLNHSHASGIQDKRVCDHRIMKVNTPSTKDLNAFLAVSHRVKSYCDL